MVDRITYILTHFCKNGLLAKNEKKKSADLGDDTSRQKSNAGLSKLVIRIIGF